MNISKAITIEGNGDGAYALSWTPSFSTDPLDIHVGTAPSRIDPDPVIEGASEQASISGLGSGLRHYFLLRRRGANDVVMAQRNVPLDGAVNFRDLGGYTTTDGRRVKWGRVFRSGHMSNLTARGKAQFEHLDIRSVCDFRTSTERAKEAMALPNEPQVDVLEIPPGVGDPEYLHRLFRETGDPEVIAQAVHEIVRSMVDQSAPRYRRMFEVLLAPSEGNILINCSAGKERTGVGSALLLTALGVPRETIYYDFMLSQVYFPAEAEIPRVIEKYNVTGTAAASRALIMPLLETRESYLRVAFDFIDEQFGGGEQFLRDRFAIGGRELAALRNRFTS